MEHLVSTVCKHGIRLFSLCHLNEDRTEGIDCNLYAVAVAVLANELLVGMMDRNNVFSVASFKSDLLVNVHVDVARLPTVVTGNDHAHVTVTAGDGIAVTVCVGKEHTVNENVAVCAVEIVDSRKTSVLVILHEPGVTVYLGSEDEAAVERLIDKIILEVINAGGDTCTVVLGKTCKSGRRRTVEDKFSVVRCTLVVAQVYVNVGLLTTEKECC